MSDIDIEMMRVRGFADEAEEIKRLRAALTNAIEYIESWSAYADPYFRMKHDLAGELARLRAVLAKA